MFIKLSDMDDMLPEVQIRDDAFTIWLTLWNLHETFDKGRAFSLKNNLLSIKMEEHGSLPDHLLKIKNIKDHFSVIDRKVELKDLVIIALKSMYTHLKFFIETLNITSNDELMFLINLAIRFCRKIAGGSNLEITVVMILQTNLVRLGQF